MLRTGRFFIYYLEHKLAIDVRGYREANNDLIYIKGVTI